VGYVEYYLSDINDVKFSGIVEIEESLFGRKLKYNKGNSRGMKVWIFGMVERNSNRLKLYPVDKRNKATLMKLITDHIEPGSTIYSDE